MKRFTRLLAIALVTFATLTACGRSSEDGGIIAPPPPPPPPPPPSGANQSPSGVWGGQAVTQGAPDVFESFEFDATGGFTRGISPFTATYTNGNAEERGEPSFYISGDNAWHILNGTSATVNFETPTRTLSLWARTAFPGDVSTIQILDVNSALITTVIPTNAYGILPTVVTRTAGETSIGSMVVTSTIGGGGGDVVIDDLTFGYLITTTTDDIFCLIAETLEFGCEVDVQGTSVLVAGAQGTVQVTGSQVTGTGTLYAAPGTTLADGSAFAPLTITGTVSERNSLNLTIVAAGFSISVSTTFVASVYDRGSALATVDDVYSAFDLFGVGDPTSFSVNNGVITSASTSGCMGIGLISIINATFNAYDVTLDVTSCGAFNGMYNGLGLTGDAFATDDVFSLRVFTSDSVIVGDPTK